MMNGRTMALDRSADRVRLLVTTGLAATLAALVALHSPAEAGVACPALADAAATADCATDDALFALSSAAVPAGELAAIRGGFVSIDGTQVNFGFALDSFADGILQLSSVLTLDQILAGEATLGQINAVEIGSDETGGSTQISHYIGPDGIGAIINNGQDGLELSTLATLTIDIVNLHETRSGVPLGRGERMPLELTGALIRSLAR